MQLFKKPKVPQQQRPAVRDDVVDQVSQADALARRRGGAADIAAGMYGDTSQLPVGKVSLGS